jgi:hypothetical protein
MDRDVVTTQIGEQLDRLVRLRRLRSLPGVEVVSQASGGQLRQLCGRYQHDAIGRTILGRQPMPEYAQASIPCTVQECPAGSRKCDCREFHDTGAAASDGDGRLERAA